ncbi:MAG TPA: dipeptide/oligopeptide/nickel ABC transporter ATP-binding protein [Blastocatellia bacterium]|nr:dipeptide/oligopeptide/nickel ABC transporter ATP-binding protein [Blastocatellia bacterium]
MANLFIVRRLTVEYNSKHSPFKALNDISLEVPHGSSICIVGSSGAGKSTFAHAILGLLASDAPMQGEVILPGRDSAIKSNDELMEYRRTKVGVIFQDAPGSLVPGVPVGRQVERVFRFRRRIGRSEALSQARAALEEVGLADHERIRYALPSELSGGMCQRVMISLALAAPGPLQLLVADEPLSALDSVSAAQILDLLLRIRAERKATMLFITHDIRLVRRFDWVALFSQGSLIEMQRSQSFLDKPMSDEGERFLAASRSLE